MAMVGHKTEAIYRRYAIVDEVMLSEAAEKLGKLWVSQPSSDPQACGEGTKNANKNGAGGGNRTLTGGKAHGILRTIRTKSAFREKSSKPVVSVKWWKSNDVITG